MHGIRADQGCFLPIREGVSLTPLFLPCYSPFPPYTGGCIGYLQSKHSCSLVSSLYGRVYLNLHGIRADQGCFLPIREGVSAALPVFVYRLSVSSLYGRVYRRTLCRMPLCPSFLPIREGVSVKSQKCRWDRSFPPYTGGCIAIYH